jgi:hypothetical protein
MGVIRQLVRDRQDMEEQIRRRAFVLQERLINLMPEAFSEWIKESDYWKHVFNALFTKAFAVVAIQAGMFGFESVEEIKQAFENLSKTWAELVNIKIEEDSASEQMIVVFEAL